MPLTLESLGDAAPSGEDLEYDPLFTELTLAAQPGEERQAGDEIIPGAEPDYRKVVDKAHAVLAQSHDLRAAVMLAQAELALNGLTGFAEVTGYLRGCLESFWDSCHPQLDADDDNDPTMRVNAVLGLADGATVLRGLRRAPLTESRQFGRFSMRDIELAGGEISPREDDDVPSTAAIGAAFKDTPGEFREATLAAARAINEDLLAIDGVFSDKTPGQGPDLGGLLKLSKRILSRLSEESGEGGDDAGEEIADAVDGAAPAAGAAAPAQRTGAITSDADVIRTLEAVIGYYEKHEPSSPLPILLRRAKRLVGADFMDIIKEIAPSGTDEVVKLGGVAAEDA